MTIVVMFFGLGLLFLAITSLMIFIEVGLDWAFNWDAPEIWGRIIGVCFLIAGLSIVTSGVLVLINIGIKP